MKKLFVLLSIMTALVMISSCGNGSEDITTDPTTASAEATEATTGDVTVTYPEPGENTMTYVPVGEHVTLVYNPAYCTVEYSSEKALGSKEDVTLSIKMCEGYLFDGWSQCSAIANGEEFFLSDAERYTFTASDDVMIYANYSATLIYHANGGVTADGGDTLTQKYSLVIYKCPNTLPDQNFITRDGYTLSEYNTMPDGSGEAVSLGSRVPLYGRAATELYCIWEKQNDPSDFKYSVGNQGITISDYVGTSKNVVIPEKIDGIDVIKIGGTAFMGSEVTRVVIPKTVATIADGAFAYSELEDLVFFDYLVSVSDKAFADSCLKNIRINAALDFYSVLPDGNNKMDRLIWAATSCPDKKKIILLGGSGTLNGFDCDSINAEFGDEYVIINLGINANVSSSMYFEFMRDTLKPDDIILWAPEAGEYVYGRTAFTVRSWQFQAGHYDIFKSIDISVYTKVFDSYASYASSHRSSQQAFDAFAIVSRDPNKAEYGRQLYNQYGDAINVRAHVPATYTDYKRSFDRCSFGFKSGDYAYAAALVSDMTSRGIRFYLIYAAMDEVSEPTFDPFMQQFTDDVLKYYKGSEVISDYHDMLMPDECMSDSAWHMTLEGAYLRTQVVIRDLKIKLGR
ncbi:MAG: leucine-rich repeat domain-containing protein [Clostridia bacterium]|nr:leucine-rich repeat domain-containing protein [Clostridia bacterium]